MTVKKLQKDLRACANPAKAQVLKRFFKTGPGEYGEGDRFIGVVVPDQRRLAREYQDLELSKVEELLQSRIHEERLLALLILTYKFSKADEKNRALIYRLYLKNAKQINNWDLVDLSAPKIVGAYLWNRDKKVLYRLAKSKLLWRRRIAMLAAYDFIKRGECADALKLAKLLMNDKHDLMHKAVGWMLRETGKNCGEKILTDFLDQEAARMPRTMLRYAIERLPEKKRQQYLAVKTQKYGS